MHIFNIGSKICWSSTYILVEIEKKKSLMLWEILETDANKMGHMISNVPGPYIGWPYLNPDLEQHDLAVSEELLSLATF